mmetsp:Transcript_10841/g.16153  ORF Transcript_10841/g.16153 Transcript_10841/m.16153 type:complete len:517 (-) Transcript_10841:174-1724(-)
MSDGKGRKGPRGSPLNVISKLPQPLRNPNGEGGKRGPSVRHEYLDKLGYTPIRLVRTDSPTYGASSSYDPTMTPVMGAKPKGYGTMESARTSAVPPGFASEDKSVASDSCLQIFGAGRTVCSTFNLLASTVGAGALSLPYAFKLCGIVGGIAAMVTSALLCVYTIRLLIKCRNKVQLCSYEDLSQHCFGKKFALFVDFNIIFFCFGTCVAYLIAIGDIVAPIAAEVLEGSDFEEFGHRKVVITLVGIFLMTPISMVESVTELRFANFFAIFVFFTLVSGVFYRGYPVIATTPISRRLLYGPGSISGFLVALPMIMYSFCCHVNVFSIYTQLHRPSIRKMSRVVTSSCGVAFLLYLILAVSGLWQFGGKTKEDILTNLGHSTPVMGTLQLLTAVNIGLGFPMNVYPSRFTIEVLLFPDAKPSAFRRHTITILFVGLVVFCAVFIPNISTVFSVIGSSSAVLVSFILPAAFYTHIKTGSVVSLDAIGPSLLFVGSLLFGLVATGSSLYAVMWSPEVLQ